MPGKFENRPVGPTILSISHFYTCARRIPNECVRPDLSVITPTNESVSAAYRCSDGDRRIRLSLGRRDQPRPLSEHAFEINLLGIVLARPLRSSRQSIPPRRPHHLQQEGRISHSVNRLCFNSSFDNTSDLSDEQRYVVPGQQKFDSRLPGRPSTLLSESSYLTPSK
jgi:hypothetical protein